MFRGDIIIDGYNVQHAAGLSPPRDLPGGLERGRLALLRQLSECLTRRERRRTTVVFDARDRSLQHTPPHEVAEVLVVFADRDGDADVAIERLIRENSAPRRLCVVSSDHRLQKAARRRRASYLDSDEFLKRLSRRSSRRARRAEEYEPTAKHSGRLPASEVEAWLRVFEGVEDMRCPANSRQRPSRVHRDSAQPPAVADHAGAGRSDTQPPRTGSTTQHQRQTHHGRDQNSRDEIAFWEARVAELDEGDDLQRD